METRQLGSSDLHITRIGFGAWAIGGGGWEYAWGAQDDQESIDAIHRILDHGVNWIDTAAVYGLGHSEEVVARALKQTSHKPYVFTKCSLVWGDDREIYSSMKADSLRREVEDSLRRLEVETIDLYQIHWPDPEPEIEEGWATLAALQQEGKLRYIGVSNFNVEQIKRAEAVHRPITSLQPPYSLVAPGVQDEILPYCLANNIGVIVYSPMASGLLTGAMTPERVANFPADDWRRRDGEFQEPRLSRNLALADVLKTIGQRHGRSAGEVAIAWTLHNPAVTGAIVGARSAKQVDGIIGGADIILTEQDLADINGFVAANP